MDVMAAIVLIRGFASKATYILFVQYCIEMLEAYSDTHIM